MACYSDTFTDLAIPFSQETHESLALRALPEVQELLQHLPVHLLPWVRS